MKLKTLIAGTVSLVFVLFAAIYYTTSPSQRKPLLRPHHHNSEGYKFEIPSVKDELPPDKPDRDRVIVDRVKSAEGDKAGSRSNALPHRPDHIQKLLGNVPPQDSIFQVSRMPEDKDLWPSLGNGHIATVVNSGAIFMDGLYNGAQAFSHRARIPSLISVDIFIASPKVPVTRTYALDVGQGIFNETIVGSFFRIEKLSYAHRTIKELFVVEVKINIHDHPSREPLVVTLMRKWDGKSEDLELTEGTCDIAAIHCSYVHGTTKQPEFAGLTPSQVHVYYSDIPPNITMADGMVELTSAVYLMSISTDPKLAKDNFDNGLRLNQRLPLRRSHISAWSSLWAEGRVDMEGNSALSQLSYSSLYYLLSCLPIETEENWKYYGMASGGLAHGKSGQDNQGHVTGDEERWIFPPVLLLHSHLSRTILDYRVRNLKVAMETAKSQHYYGALYPWEAGYTGHSLSEVKSRDHHRHYVSGDIAVAVQQYMWLTNDTAFLTKGQGSEMIKAIAEFWESRIMYDAKRKVYNILGVIPPGKSTSPVDNSLYTNTVAKASLLLPGQLLPNLGIQFSDKFKAFADSLYIPFNKKLQYNPAHDKFKPGAGSPDTEVIPINIALMDDSNIQVKKNNLKIYEKAASSTSSGLIQSALAVNWLAVKDLSKAEQSLNRSLEFVKGPFKIWSEDKEGNGAINFMPGMAAYLQTLLFGYAGLRIQEQQLIFDPILPPRATRVTVQNVDYLGQSLTFMFDKKHTVITWNRHTEKHILLVVIDMATSRTLHFQQDNTVTLKANTKGAILQGSALVKHKTR